MTCEQSARTIIAALKKVGHSEEETHAIFDGVFFGEAWESYELYVAIKNAFKEGN
jgi:hypothetical protein